MENIPSNTANKLRIVLDDVIPYKQTKFDIKYAVELCGGKIIENQSLNYDAHIKKIKKDSFIIEINPEKPETRQRFSIAHELGHWFLHINEDIENKIFKRNINVPYSITETEANEFAAEFLMPEDIFKSKARINRKFYTDKRLNLNRIINDVATEFGVSYDAAYIRGKVLGLWR